MKSNPAASIPALGQYWPGEGGVFFALIRGENGKPDARLVAASDTDGNLKRLTASYGCFRKTVGASSYRDGQVNAEKLLEHGSPMAKACAEVEADGHRDFYPPSQCEVNMLRANLADKIAGVGWVWSSTEYSGSYAWCQLFGVGNQYIYYKDDEYSVFPVRRVPVSP